MKKLLEKLSQEKSQDLSNDGEFERRLDEILRRYKIKNDAFVAEVINLHKQYWYFTSSMNTYSLLSSVEVR